MKLFRFLGNVIWFIFTGLVSAIGFFLLGLLWCITIIGIPFGLQCFKYAKLVLWPMGKVVDSNFGAHPIANVLWFIFGGFGLALTFLFEGLVYCVSIIGIPFGLQCFKFAKLSMFPFGGKITSK
mgnify:CR=1 FL=1